MATIEVKDSQEKIEAVLPDHIQNIQQGLSILTGEEKEDLIRIVKNQENREFEKALCFFISFAVLRLQIGV